MSGYGEYDEETGEIDEPENTYAFKTMDVFGALIHTAGRVCIAFGSGLQDVAECFRQGAWHQRATDVENAELALDRNEFDHIISQPVLLDEPGEE